MTTFGLAAVLIAVYWLELHFSVDPMPFLAVSPRDDVAFGGVSPYFVFHEGEWWRIFTAPWLHGSRTHLIGNLVVLIYAGFVLERMVGSGWLAALFVVGALGGSLGSLAYSSGLVSVGASGALMCLITVLFVISFHHVASEKATRHRWRAFRLLVLAFLPSAAATHIDYGAHFGGFAIGIALGFLLLAQWPEESSQPPLQDGAFYVAVAGICVTIFAAFQVQAYMPIYAARSAELLPSVQMAIGTKELERYSAALADDYPHDPMVRLVRGLEFLHEHDNTDAEEEVRKGLSEDVILDSEYAPVLRDELETVLAASLWAQGRHDEAKPMLAHICATTSSDPFLENSRKIFERHGACS